MINCVDSHFIAVLFVDVLKQGVVRVIVRGEKGQPDLTSVRVVAIVEDTRIEPFVVLGAKAIIKTDEDDLRDVARG